MSKQLQLTDFEDVLLQEAFHEHFGGFDGPLNFYGLTSLEEVAKHYPATRFTDQVEVCKAVESLAKKLGYTEEDIREMRARNK